MRSVLLAIVAVAACGYTNRIYSSDLRPASGQTPSSATSASEAAAVRRGRYLTLAGNCVSCHTTPGGELFAGGVAFVTPFGTIRSSNITPEVATGIGSWSEIEFRAALRDGVRPNGEHLYPAFPYTAFTKLSDTDVADLFAYLRSIAPRHAALPPNDLKFPFNQRWLIGLWNALFLDKGPLRAASAQTAEWNRGAYLVEALAHCSACHTPRNVLGAERQGLRMAGGILNDEVADGAVRPWSAPNLSAAPRGLALWTVQDLAAYLKTGKNDFVTTFGPMNEVILNSTRHLSDADIRAMSVYLKSLPAQESDPSQPGLDPPRLGGILYSVYCGTCHLPTGLGDAESAPRLAHGSLVVQASDPASLINVILYGPDLPNPPLTANHWRPMEAFGDRLSDAEVAAVASYVRSAWGNHAGSVSPAQVARQRLQD